MLEYKIIKGVRHYRMSPNEPWKEDKLSQAEVDRRLAPQTPAKKPASQVRTTSQKKKSGMFGLLGGR